ncbi:MAG: histidine phosphatase family protein [Leifsonia sp.]|nr:histidine phosphatase family protein [Leifsonia sp.]
MRLLLIRHGQTPDNVLGQLGTARPGPGLTELGMRQAAGLPRALRDEQIDAIYASTLLRTQLTAEPLALDRGFNIEVRDGLHEISAGALEARSDRQAVRTYIETAFAWAAGDLDVAMPGGADGHEFFGRYNADLAAIAASGAQTAAVVSHGAAIRVWVAAHAINVERSFPAGHELANTGVVVVDGSFESGWMLTQWAGTPLGGPELADAAAPDPTGETLSEARADSE